MRKVLLLGLLAFLFPAIARAGWKAGDQLMDLHLDAGLPASASRGQASGGFYGSVDYYYHLLDRFSLGAEAGNYWFDAHVSPGYTSHINVFVPAVMARMDLPLREKLSAFVDAGFALSYAAQKIDSPYISESKGHSWHGGLLTRTGVNYIQGNYVATIEIGFQTFKSAFTAWTPGISAGYKF